MLKAGWVRQAGLYDYECTAAYEQWVIDYVRRVHPNVHRINIDVVDFLGPPKTLVINMDESTRAIAKRLFLEGLG